MWAVDADPFLGEPQERALLRVGQREGFEAPEYYGVWVGGGLGEVVRERDGGRGEGEGRTVGDYDGGFPRYGFVGHGFGEVDSEEDLVLQVAGSVGCFEEYLDV